MIEIATVSDERAFERLRPEWEALWRRDPTATPFQWPGWIIAWWRNFGTAEPLILTARVDGLLVGLLPLYLLREDGCCKLLPVGVGLADYVEALTDPPGDQVALHFLANAAAMPVVDEIWMPDLADDGPLARAARCLGPTYQMGSAAPCPVVSLPESDAGIGTIVPKKTSRYVRQAQARTASAGGADIKSVPEHRLGKAMNELFRLHAARWNEKDKNGLGTEHRLQNFHRQAACELFSAGMLRLYRLTVAGGVCGVYYGLLAKGIAYGYLSGYDPSQSWLRPGAQLIAHAVKAAIAEHAVSFDFLRGHECYKYSWGARDRRKVSLRLSRGRRHAELG